MTRRVRRTICHSIILTLGIALVPTAIVPSAQAVGTLANSLAVDKPQLIDRAYVVAQSGGVASLDMYSDGSIRRNSPNVPTGAGTFGPVASPDGKYLYVAPGRGLGSHTASEDQSPQLDTFRVMGDGSLRRVAEALDLDPKLTTVTGAISSDGRDLYWGVGDLNGIATVPAGFTNGAILHFRVGNDGLPTQVGAPMPLGLPNDGAAEPIISRDGKWLYVASVLSTSIVRFGINPDGTLTPPIDRTYAGLTNPITPVLSPNGRFLYVAQELDQRISGFEIKPDGSLVPIPGSPFLTGSVPHGMTFNESGTVLYGANTAGNLPTGLLVPDGSISAFSVRPDGRLVHLPGSPYPSKPGAMMMNMSSSGDWVYLTSGPGTGDGAEVEVTAYRIRPDGGLQTAGAQSFNTGLTGSDGPQTAVIPVR